MGVVLKTGGLVNQCWVGNKKSFDEAEDRVRLGYKKVFWGPSFVKNGLAKTPLKSLMSKNSLKINNKHCTTDGPKNDVFLLDQTQPSASSKQLFITHQALINGALCLK